MVIDPLWFAIEQLKRVVESLGWQVIASSTEGPAVRLTLEKNKEKILAP